MLLLFHSRFTVLTLMLTMSVELHAQERQFVLGTTIDLVSGGSSGQNAAGITPSNGSKPPGSFFYEAYPSLQMKAVGRHSSFESSYAFGLSRLSSDLGYNSDSHGASAKLYRSLAPSWKLTVSDS